MEVLPFFEYSLYQMYLLFCFWSFIGWCIEVVDMTLETGEYQNRGFLNMPICPIYGFGVLMIMVFFRPLSNTFVPLLIASTILCTSFEFFMGWGMEKLFHTRWWDYSHMKFNFMGYICLRNSLFFGFGCVLVVRVVEPIVENAVDAIPVKLGLVFIVIMSVLIVLDTSASIIAVKKLNDKIKRLDEISEIMLGVSVKTGMKLANGALKVKSTVYKIGDVKDNVVEKVQDMSSANIEKLKLEYERLITEKDAATERLVKAFPRMRSHTHGNALQLIKDKIYGKLVKISVFESDESEDDTAETVIETENEKEDVHA